MLLGYIDPGTGFVISSLGGWVFALLLGASSVFLLFFKKIFKFTRRHGKIMAIVMPTIILVALLIGAFMLTKKSAFNNKVVVLGLDALSPDIIEPLMASGELPNFSRLKELGSYSRLRTTNPPQSPVAWAAFATGQNPGKNGVFDFIIRNPKTYGLSLALSNITGGRPRGVIKTDCFWQYASRKVVPSVILNCPLTFPPDKLRGRMLSGMGVPDILGTEGTFTFYTTETLDDKKDVGGKVFHIRKSPVMIMNLIGPKVSSWSGRAENTKVPFKVILNEASAVIEYGGSGFELTSGEWSTWKEAVFNIGFFRKAKGIFKFYLAETSPEFKLYISPINYDPRDPFFQISYPKRYSADLANTIGLYYTQGMPMDTWAVNEKRLSEEAFLNQAEEIFKEKTAMLDLEFERLKSGILFMWFESVDIIQHMFWRYSDPGHALHEPNAPKEYREMIKTWYKKMDAVLGNILGGIDERDTLIVLSDHGFNAFRRAGHVNAWLRENGYLNLKGPEMKSGGELLKDIDWSSTRAYAIGFGAIYVNQRGREKFGIVEPGGETESIKEEISKRLKGWMDPKFDKAVVKDVYKREDIFWGRYAQDAPDLYIGFNVGYRASWQTALGAVPEGLIEDNLKKWSGDHLFDPDLIPGVIFANRKITKEAPSIYDAAPTILKIIGLGEKELKECGFDGDPLF